MNPADARVAEGSPDKTAALLGKDRWIKDLGLRVLHHPLTARAAGALQFDLRPWDDIERLRVCEAWLREFNPGALDALEISGNRWAQFGFRTHGRASFPAYDVCDTVLEERYDIIIADRIFEHLRYPYRAAKNVHEMLRPGGHFLMCTPFLVKVHPSPINCCRWTEDGLRYFLEECGFEDVRTGSWGNKACVKAFLRIWMPRGWSSIRNHPEFPIVVWALAHRTSS